METFEYKVEFIEVLCNKGSFGKNGVLIQDVVITFNVEQIIIPDVTTFVEIVFDNKCHITERKIYEVSKDYPVLGNIFDSMAFFELEAHSLSVKIADVEIITFDFAAAFAIYNVIIFCKKNVSLTILEWQSVFLNVKRVDLNVF